MRYRTDGVRRQGGKAGCAATAAQGTPGRGIPVPAGTDRVYLILQRPLRLLTASPGQLRQATLAMTLLGNPLPFLPPGRPAQDLGGVPVAFVQQMPQQRPYLGDCQLWLFFPPTAAVAAPGTRGPAATRRCDDATPPSPASHIHPTRTRLCPPRNSVRPTSADRAPPPASAKGPPPARWSGGTSLPPSGPANAAPASAPSPRAGPPPRTTPTAPHTHRRAALGCPRLP